VTDPGERPYHHGNLRRALLDAAVEVIAEEGPDALRLRDLANRTGVSHGAPAHHFTDRAGLLTAIAAEGYELLGDVLERARDQGGFLDVGLAYVRFAVEHPAHFQVMFQPTLYRPHDPAVAAAKTRTSAALYGSAATARSGQPAAQVGLAGWCLMHGLATLWLAGNLDLITADPVDLARSMATTTFASPPPRRRTSPTPPARPIQEGTVR
jgi:AcrR family transcriptional regulator